jgi:hypothetical protein
MQWFFSFANRNNNAVKNMLAKKPMYVKKKREGDMVGYEIY